MGACVILLNFYNALYEPFACCCCCIADGRPADCRMASIHLVLIPPLTLLSTSSVRQIGEALSMCSFESSTNSASPAAQPFACITCEISRPLTKPTALSSRSPDPRCAHPQKAQQPTRLRCGTMAAFMPIEISVQFHASGFEQR